MCGGEETTVQGSGRGADIAVRPAPIGLARSLRDEVLRGGFPPGGSVYPGDDAPETLHLGAFARARLVAVATICQEPPPGGNETTAWRLRGMATLPGYRGRGLGARLAKACLAHAKARGGSMVWCSAREGSADFYARLGFARAGGPYRLPRFSDATYVQMRSPL